MTDLVPYTAVAGGCSTLSKNPALFPESLALPLIAADGSQVTDANGKQLTDWIAGLLAITLGHRHPAVTTAVMRHLSTGGPTWSLPHALETEAAERILHLMGMPDGQVRFFKTGSEACSAAVRVARTVTGRDIIVTSGYHGWHDGLLTTPPAWGRQKGVMGAVRSVPFNDLAAGERLFYGMDSDPAWLNREDASCAGDQIAAVIVEPETLEFPDPAYLDGLYNVCERFGALLIFDEAISAGRHYEFTVGQHFGVRPHLTILAKCLANGWPLACMVGERKHMRCFDVNWSPDYVDGGPYGPVYCSGTFSGETASLAACLATLTIWERDDVGERLQSQGAKLRAGLIEEALAADLGVTVKGQNYRLVLDCDVVTKTFLMRHMLDAGHLIGAGWNISAAHSDDDIASAVAAFGSALHSLAKAREAGGYQEVKNCAGRPVAQPYRSQA